LLKLRYIYPTIIVAVLASVLQPLSVAGKSAKKTSTATETWAENANQRKADYIYMEAMRQNSLDNDDAFYMLMQRARELDSSDTQPGLALGYYYMALGSEDAKLTDKGYNMMRDHFNAHPDDYYGAIFYGMVNNQIGNVNESIRVWETLDSLNPDKPDVTLKFAEALQASRDSANLRRSITVLNRLERAEGHSLGLTSHKVRALMALRDTAATRNEVQSLLGASSRNASNMIYAGDVFTVLHQPDSAIAYYNRACETDSTNGIAYYKRAEFYQQRGDSLAYDREVLMAVKQEGLDLDVKLDIFSNYIRQLYTDSIQRPRIESIFDNLLEQNPHEPQVRDLYSSYLIAIENYAAAAEQQEYALDADPSDENRWRSAMSLYNRADNYQKSYELGVRAMHYLPDNAMITFYTSTALSMLNRDDEALELLNKTLELADSTDRELMSAIYSSMGDVNYKRGDVTTAIGCYDKAIEINPENYTALNNCAYFMAENGIDLDKAERMSAICVRQQPDNDTALDTYAWIFFKKKDYARAKEMIDRAVAIESEDPQADVLHHAGDIYYMNGEPESAIEFWEEALKLDPDNKLLQKKVKNRTHYYE
jgi:tetratricopeptide (TPR) repeat protein